MNKKIMVTTVMLSALMISQNAFAAKKNSLAPNWNTAQVEFVNVKEDSQEDLSFYGGTFEGNVLLTDYVILNAAYKGYFDKQDSVKYSVSEYSLGLGMRFNPFDRVDMYGLLSYNPKTYSSDLMIEDNKVNGISVAFGAKYVINKKVEVGAVITEYVRNNDTDQDDLLESDLSLKLHGHYLFTKNYSISASYEIGSERSIAGVGFRYSF